MTPTEPWISTRFIFRVLKECLFQNFHTGVRSDTDWYPDFADWKTENGRITNSLSRFAQLDFARGDFFPVVQIKKNKTPFLHLLFFLILLLLILLCTGLRKLKSS